MSAEPAGLASAAAVRMRYATETNRATLPSYLPTNPGDRLDVLMWLAATEDEDGNPIDPIITQEQLRVLLDTPC